ncbi:MAG: hypothetical protein KJ709_09370 [Nanoarchaeota archaeon]|nr:hypothetical protein [Nanoarchaeota archaeon]
MGVERITIKDMKPGDHGWTVSWALGERNGQHFLDRCCYLSRNPGGTAQVLVKKQLNSRYIAHYEGSDFPSRVSGVSAIPVEMVELHEVFKLKDMVSGQSGYVVPWALELGWDTNMYLDLEHTYSHRKGGTVQMLVRRINTEDTGFQVDISQVDFYKWSVADHPRGPIPIEVKGRERAYSKISELPIQKCGYTSSRAVQLGMDGEYYLDTGQILIGKKGGGLDVLVARASEEGYLVNLSRSEGKWEPVENPNGIRPLHVVSGPRMSGSVIIEL